jgi:hypothetical protein
LLEQVYRVKPGDAVFDSTLPLGCFPRLKPTTDALRALSVVR